MSDWKAIAEKKLDTKKTLFTHRITSKGNMAKALKNVKVANKLINNTTGLETEFLLK